MKKLDIPKTKTIGIRISEEEKKWIEDRACEEKRSVSEYIKLKLGLLDEYVNYKRLEKLKEPYTIIIDDPYQETTEIDKEKLKVWVDTMLKTKTVERQTKHIESWDGSIDVIPTTNWEEIK